MDDGDSPGNDAPGHGLDMERALGALVGKTPDRTGNKVMSLLLTHLLDTAAVGELIWDHYLAPSLRKALAGPRALLERLDAAVRAPAYPLALGRRSCPPTQPRRREAAAPGERIRGFRHAHRTAATQLEWFLTRTGKWGFEVPAARTEPAAPGVAVDAVDVAVNRGQGRRPDPNPAREVRITGRSRHSFAKGGRGPHVVFHSATFEGRLKVVDPAAFATRLLHGIGPSKAYGCGLLTLAPLPAPGSAPAPPSDPPVTPGSSPSPAGTPPR